MAEPLSSAAISPSVEPGQPERTDEKRAMEITHVTMEGWLRKRREAVGMRALGLLGAASPRRLTAPRRYFRLVTADNDTAALECYGRVPSDGDECEESLAFNNGIEWEGDCLHNRAATVLRFKAPRLGSDKPVTYVLEAESAAECRVWVNKLREAAAACTRLSPRSPLSVAESGALASTSEDADPGATEARLRAHLVEQGEEVGSKASSKNDDTGSVGSMGYLQRVESWLFSPWEEVALGEEGDEMAWEDLNRAMSARREAEESGDSQALALRAEAMALEANAKAEVEAAYAAAEAAEREAAVCNGVSCVMGAGICAGLLTTSLIMGLAHGFAGCFPLGSESTTTTAVDYTAQMPAGRPL